MLISHSFVFVPICIDSSNACPFRLVGQAISNDNNNNNNNSNTCNNKAI